MNWLNETNSSILHKPLCNISSLGLCTPRVAWWRGITSASDSADTWTFSRAFPLPTCLEGLRNQSVTLAGMVCCSKGNCSLDQTLAPPRTNQKFDTGPFHICLQVFSRPRNIEIDASRSIFPWPTPEGVRTVFTSTSGFLMAAQV